MSREVREQVEPVAQGSALDALIDAVHDMTDDEWARTRTRLNSLMVREAVIRDRTAPGAR